MSPTSELHERADAVTKVVSEGLLDGERLQIVKAPPGAGKTHLLLQLLSAGFEQRMRLAVATFTNAQADDVCERLAREHPSVRVARFISKDALDPSLPGGVAIVRSRDDLPHGPSVVVASVAKWGLTEGEEFDVLLVDEAWQIQWADFILLRHIAPRFVLIGDPGQIPPVVSIETNRWETSPSPPHLPAPELLLSHESLGAQLEELPGSRRLPADAVEVVNEFYDFEFGAFAEAGERFVRLASPGKGSGIDAALDLLAETSVVGTTIPTPDDGPPVEVDDQIAREIGKLVARLLDREPVVSDCADTRRRPRRLEPKDIGIVSTHRTMNTRLHHGLSKPLQREVRVDTPERWQGLERKVMIAVHPLSGVTDPTSFELETGRLCVMASRHRCGLVMMSRDHVPDTLRSHIVSAEQPVGRVDMGGLGHHRHSRFWDQMVERHAVVPL